MISLTVYYPDGKTATYKNVKEVAIAKHGIVFSKGKRPAKFKLNQWQYNEVLLKIED